MLTLLAQRLDGGTTVSGTMAVAHLAGIKIFSTGGIGGVHRGAETSEQTGWDSSHSKSTYTALNRLRYLVGSNLLGRYARRSCMCRLEINVSRKRTRAASFALADFGLLSCT